MTEREDEFVNGGRLQGKVALVTGAGRGIGRVTAQLFAAEGASVAVAARHEASAGAAAGSMGDGLPLWGDVGSPNDAEALVKRTADHFGRLDVVIHCAGFFYRSPALDMTPEEWDDVIRTNLSGSFYIAQAAARAMQDGGEIVLLSSVWGRAGGYGRAAYSASKAGVDALTRVIAAEWAPRNIRVYAVAPGWVGTETNTRLIAEGKMNIERMTALAPTRPLVQPVEVAELCLTLASGAHPMLSGTTINLDGGLGGWMGDV